ncbi:Transmembrane protease serine 3, partial [Pseudolycoriella hygida]
VAIRLYDNFLPSSGGDVNLCNGAIIHESYVLTTADCVHARIRSANLSRPYNPSMLYIAAGTFLGDPFSTRYVETITVHEKYNADTLENDIALVKTSEPFPLRNNTAIQWIELDSVNTRYDHCFASFQNSTSSRYPYSSPQPAYVMDNWYCNYGLNGTNLTQRNSEICSHYVFSDSAMCRLQPYQLQISSDRGTPLVCNNRLSGLLSQILPPQNSSNPSTACENTLKTWAFYTKVSNFTSWIHQTIARQQPLAGTGPTPSHQPPVTPPPYYTPPVTQATQGGKPKGSSADCLAKSLSIALTVFCVIFNFSV